MEVVHEDARADEDEATSRRRVWRVHAERQSSGTYRDYELRR
jgi:hypothetical protein